MDDKQSFVSKLQLGPFSGMNNRAEDHALPIGTKEDPRAAVRNAVNADFTNAGKAKRRKGSTKKYNGFDLKYGFSCSQGQFVVEDVTLKKIDSAWAATDIYNGVFGSTFSHYEHDGNVFFSDKLIGLKLTNGVAQRWGMANPSVPTVYTQAGLLGAGVYLCCITFYDALGNESGASDIVSLSVDANSSIVFTNLPSSQDSQVTGIRMYMTTANGNVFYQCGDVAIGTLSYTVVLPPDGGKVIDTLFMTRPPAGQIIREHNGRLLIAYGSYLYVTEPYSTDLVSQLSKSVFQFSADITVVEPVDDGVWIVADKTFFFAGSGPENYNSITKLKYGATLGTGQKIADGIVSWFSTRGLIMAGNKGEIKNVQEDTIAPDYGDTGTMLIREEDGMRQAITSIQQPTISTLAAKSWIDAEVIRRGE